MSEGAPQARAGRYDAVVVGGGFAGAMTAVQATRQHPGMRVALVERSGEPGLGVAYATEDERHLLNVPAARMGAFPDEPGGFLAWLQGEGKAVEPGQFMPRRDYGRYLRSVVAGAVADAESAGGCLDHVASEAVALRPAGEGGESVELADGELLVADEVVLALGAQPSRVLPTLPGDDPRVFSSPWEAGALDPGDGGPSTVLVVGSGLTAVDATLSLCGRDPHARVVAVSRGGQLPFVHLPEPIREHVPAPIWERPLTAEGMAAAFRSACDDAAAGGADWRDVVDAVRHDIPELWVALGVDGQRSFLDRYMRAWEVRRHRMAPGVAAELGALRARGAFELRSGTVTTATPTPAGIEVALGHGERLVVQRVVSCTGPGLDIRSAPTALLQQLLGEGRATADAHHIGLRADDDGRLVGADGAVQPGLLTIGSLRRGELWETTAVPEIRVQAQRLAAVLGRGRSRVHVTA